MKNLSTLPCKVKINLVIAIELLLIGIEKIIKLGVADTICITVHICGLLTFGFTCSLTEIPKLKST